MDFEGTNSQGETEDGIINVLIEATKDPEAIHMSMAIESSSVEELGGAANVELYSVDGNTYMQNPEDGSWLAFPNTGETESIFSQGFFSPDELVDLPANARRDPEPQTVNGISAWHYTFDESDLEQTDMTIEDASGEIWVAEEGGYPVKMMIDVTGSSTDPTANDFMASGTFHLEYELLDVNADFTITPPEEALNAESLGGSFGMEEVDPASIEWPLMADAEIDFAMEGLVSYLSASTIADVVDFYKAEMPNAGWTYDESSEFVSDESAMMSFTKEGETLNLIISNDENGKVSVMMSTGE
jgi:hypothetical protein